jgi:hypothetical protein
MIPVYQAIEFKEEMIGGSTQPWQVTVLKNGAPVSYVVKLYTEKSNEANCTILKECVCSRLAKEFDLQTPEPALIDFSPQFIETLPVKFQTALKRRDPRLKFGTELLKSPYQNYSPSLQEKYLKNYDLGSIYAFDNLILNVDRRVDKPNLLFKNESAVLIDHELTFATSQNTLNQLNNNSVWAHNHKRHIFYEVLSNLNFAEQAGLFDDFSYYLRDLIDFKFIDTIMEQLDEHGHRVDAYISIKDYLCTVQEKTTLFIQLITDTI